MAKYACFASFRKRGLHLPVNGNFFQYNVPVNSKDKHLDSKMRLEVIRKWPGSMKVKKESTFEKILPTLLILTNPEQLLN